MILIFVFTVLSNAHRMPSLSSWFTGCQCRMVKDFMLAARFGHQRDQVLQESNFSPHNKEKGSSPISVN